MKAPTIDRLLTLAAQRRPDGPAVVDRDRTLTYAELDSDSSRLAHALREYGVAPGDRVGLLLEKSLEAIAAVYGILKAGATYVPLDERAPVRRLAYIARDADIRCLVSSESRWALWDQLRSEGAPLTTLIVAGAGATAEPVDGVSLVPWTALGQFAATPPTVAVAGERLAYVLYTSGSTGEPKGVMLSHHNGLAFVDWAAREVGVTPADRLSSHAPLHFDLSTFDLFAAAWGAAPVVLVPREKSIFPIELARFVREQRLTVWYSVPSILTQLVLRADFDRFPPDRLRTVIFAGEVFPVKYLRRLIELVPSARLLNFYGPTETNVCTWYEVDCDHELGDSIPIGWPLPRTDAIVQRDDGSIAPDGEPGELLIRGPTVMHGYWGDPERTARALTVEGSRRTYRTGDLVRREADGTLIYIGRRDGQVKTRGYRVELGEIEAAMNALEAVIECVVIAVPDEAITNRLKAFVACHEGVSVANLVGRCAERLPPYMIPQEFDLRDTLPKSSTGKLDRRQLLEEELESKGHGRR